MEEKIAKLAGADRAKLFASGMGAISAAIMSVVKADDHIITIKNTYGPASNFLGTYLVEKMNCTITYVEGKDLAEFEAAITDKTSLIYLESPSSAVMSLQDLEGISKLAKPRNIKTICDNTWATFLYQKTLSFGIDYEVHSCSKYICGHSDVVAGVVISNEENMKKLFLTEAALLGAKIAPFEAWLLLRSLRTLPIRLEQHSKSTAKVVEFLEASDFVTDVYYPGATNFDQKELRDKQMTKSTGLLSFELKSNELEKIKKFVNSLELFSIGVSWGGHESLVYAPAISYIKEMSPEKFEMMGIKYGTIRISVGLEDVEDLINDLEQAFQNLV